MSLALHDVHVRLGRRAVLHGVDLELRPGELLSVVGPNGAGKSTLLRTLAGELTPTRGRVTLDGRALHTVDARSLALRRGVLPQKPTLSAPFRVEEVVRLGRHPHRARRAVDDAAVRRALRTVGLLDRAGDVWTRLSGGEQQRVSLARVLAQLDRSATSNTLGSDPGWGDTATSNTLGSDPGGGDLVRAPILLLDEPTAALDLAWQHRVLHIAREVVAAGGSVLVVLHDLALAAAVSDRVALVHDGRLLACGPPDAVLTPASLERAYGVRVRRVHVDGLGHVPVVVGLTA